MYVTDLVAPDTVNTMPEATIEAFADHGEIAGDTVTANYADAQQVIDRLAALGIEYDDVVAGARATRAWRSSRSPGTSCSTPSATALDDGAPQ